MRPMIVLSAILALVLSAACSKPEPEVRETPAPAATESMPEETVDVTEPTETPGDEAPEASVPEQGSAAPAATPAPAQPATQAPAASPTTQVQPVEPAPAAPPAAPATTAPADPAAAAPAARPKSDKLPKNHTVDHGGAMHAPGEETPAKRCASCHGAELKGGKIAQVSCFECHEKNWP
jgi:hypothetical protein